MRKIVLLLVVLFVAVALCACTSGSDVEFQLNDNLLQWRTAGGNWQTLADTSDWRGADGKDGQNGADGDNGVDGVNGADGQAGTNGESPILRMEGTVMQWKYASQDEWHDLLDLQSVQTASTPVWINQNGYWVIDGVATNIRAQGVDGKNGANGVDAQNIVLRADETMLQWKYERSEDWNDLIDLSSLCQDNASVAINEDGYWVIDGQATEIKAKGENGQTPTVAINEDGYWVINGQSSTVSAKANSGGNAACVYISETAYDLESVQYLTLNAPTQIVGTDIAIQNNFISLADGTYMVYIGGFIGTADTNLDTTCLVQLLQGEAQSIVTTCGMDTARFSRQSISACAIVQGETTLCLSCISDHVQQ